MEDLIFCSGKKGDAYNSGLFISRNSKDPLYMDGTANCFSKLDEVDEVLPRANLTKYGGLLCRLKDKRIHVAKNESMYSTDCNADDDCHCNMDEEECDSGWYPCFHYIAPTFETTGVTEAEKTEMKSKQE